MSIKKYKYIGPAILVLTGLSNSVVHADSLRLVANSPSALLNQPVRVDVALNTQGDDANAVQGEIDFSAARFSLQNIVDGASPVSFWIEQPTMTASGVVEFSGIIPGGFDGIASSVVSLWLVPIKPGPGIISLTKVQLFRNDGQATPIPVASSSVMVSVSPMAATSTPSHPVSLVTPEPFIPVISSDQNVYGGKYFLVFSTTDKGSGIDHYEVAEIPAGRPLDGSTIWQVATSPYLLEDQSLFSDIYVRAVDHYGNFIVVKVPARNPGLPGFVTSYFSWLIAAIIAIFVIAGVVIVLRHWHHRRRRHEEG